MADVVIATSEGRLTEAEVLGSDLDMIPVLSSLSNRDEFRRKLRLSRSEICGLISRHLGIRQSEFSLSEPTEWIWGGFNVCLPIHIIVAQKFGLPQRAIIRFAVPFNVGEEFSPGSVDEKVRCEAATYIWLRANCSAVPIPRLLGMGFPGACSFTAVENESLWNRMIWRVRQVLAWSRGHVLPPYFAHRRDSLADLGYIIIEFVEEGKMLSSSWKKHRHDERRRSNLYHGLAKIMLSLASVPLPRIGSWTIDDRGFITLTNRPLSDLTVIWNKHRISGGIPRDLTYSSTERYVQDMLAYQDNRMRYQPNSINSENDGIYQLSALVALRALFPKFWDRGSCDGPYVLTLTDLHQSNMFVDDDWNITRLIDLEYVPARPVQMVGVPSWLNDRGVDQLDGPYLDEYKALYDEYVSVVGKEEKSNRLADTYSQRLREDWVTGRAWYLRALDSINAYPMIFERHIQPRYYEDLSLKIERLTLMRLWDEDVAGFLAEKLKDKENYVKHIQGIFAAAMARESEKRKVAEGEGEDGVVAEVAVDLENDAEE